jgi:hypothetical protein
LFGGELVESWEDGWIDAAGVVQKSAGYGLDSLGALLVEARGYGGWRGRLWRAPAVTWLDPFVGCMLGLFGGNVIEFFESAMDITWHGDVYRLVCIIPVDGQSAV